MLIAPILIADSPVSLEITFADDHVLLDGKAPIVLDITVRNESKQKIEIWSCGFWQNHRIETKAAGKPLKLTKTGSRLDSLFGSLERYKNLQIIVQPGHSCSYKSPDLRHQFNWVAGHVSFRVVYKDSCFVKPLLLSSRAIVLDYAKTTPATLRSSASKHSDSVQAWKLAVISNSASFCPEGRATVNGTKTRPRY